ncbi:MAG: 23S rRNA (guanosine(2251)-2'-O)-methyltransferase RlmB [Chloroflexota bacterium]
MHPQGPRRQTGHAEAPPLSPSQAPPVWGGDVLYGRNAVYESLRAGRRAFHRLLLAEGLHPDERLRHIQRLAAAYHVPIHVVTRAELGRIAGGHHQGVALEAGPYPYVTLEDILQHAAALGQPPLVLILDLLQDPQNLGTLIRTAEAVGVHGVVIQERRAAAVTPAVVRASAGAVEHMRVAQVTNLVRAMEHLKAQGLWLVGLEATPEARPYDQVDLSGPLGLVVGSEGAGPRRLVRKTCDLLVRLPMRGKVTSLNAAVAGSIVLYLARPPRPEGSTP